VDKPEWYDLASELRLLEGRIRSSILLDSKDEYKQWLLRYAKVLGDEGFRGRAEELVKEMMGPVYHHPGKASSWDPKVCGLQKRDLVKQVLTTLGQTTALSGLAQQYQAIQRAIATEEAT